MPSNLLRLDYAAEAKRLSQLPFPITDVHTHLSGAMRRRCWQVAEAYGVQRVYSMTPLEELDDVASVLGDRVRFIATPDVFAVDRWYALTEGYAQRFASSVRKGFESRSFGRHRGIDFAEQARNAGKLVSAGCDARPGKYDTRR